MASSRTGRSVVAGLAALSAPVGVAGALATSATEASTASADSDLSNGNTFLNSGWVSVYFFCCLNADGDPYGPVSNDVDAIGGIYWEDWKASQGPHYWLMGQDVWEGNVAGQPGTPDNNNPYHVYPSSWLATHWEDPSDLVSTVYGGNGCLAPNVTPYFYPCDSSHPNWKGAHFNGGAFDDNRITYDNPYGNPPLPYGDYVQMQFNFPNP